MSGNIFKKIVKLLQKFLGKIERIQKFTKSKIRIKSRKNLNTVSRNLFFKKNPT